MSIVAHATRTALALLVATSLAGCEESAQEAPTKTAAKQSVSVVPSVASAAPSAKAPPKLRDDCPEGSSGVGTFDEPCKASGDSRMMLVEYTGKTTDEGPKFSVTNQSKLPILHGSVAVYFYDKAGKQLTVNTSSKPQPKLTCGGNIFAGEVKPGEKIYVFFSCVGQKHVPEGTAAIEAEVQTVGFADETGKRNEFYWRNDDLAPNERAKGSGKTKTKKK